MEFRFPHLAETPRSGGRRKRLALRPVISFQAKNPSTAAASAHHNSMAQADEAQESRDLVVNHS